MRQKNGGNDVTEIKIEKHALEGWTPDEASKWFSDSGITERDRQEKAETLRSGDVEGRLYRTVERNGQGYCFLWAWDCETYGDQFYDTADAARADLVDRINMELQHIQDEQEEEEKRAAAEQRLEKLRLGPALSAVPVGTASVPTASPEPAAQIKRHKLSDRTPEEVFARQRKIDQHFDPIDEGELAETLTFGSESGEIARYVTQHDGAVVFRWAWACSGLLEKDFLTLERARQDLIDRLRWEIEVTAQDRQCAEEWAAAKNAVGS